MAVSYVRSGTNAVQATAGSALSVPYPTLSAGDLIVLNVGTSVATAFPSTAATGFTRYGTNSAGGSTPGQATFWRVATGAETGSVSVTSPGGTTQGSMHIYRGVDTTTPFEQGVVYSNATATTSFVLPAQTPSLAGSAIHMHAVGNAATGTYTPPGGYTELVDNPSPSPNNWAAYLINPAVGVSTGTRTITRSGSVRGAAMAMVIRPAAVVAFEFAGWGIQI